MPQYTVPLSIIDQNMPKAHTSMWLTFPCQDPEANFITLRSGLDETVKQLPFLSGEIFENSDDRDRTWVTWSDDDPKIEWEEVLLPENSSYTELAARNMPLHELPFDFRPTALKDSMKRKQNPALIASYTKIEGGLIVLAAPHHHIMDGAGRELIFRLWASNCCALSESMSERHQCLIELDEPLTRSQRLGALLAKTSPSKDSQVTTMEPALSSSPSELAASAPSPVSRKLVRFSIKKLDALRRSIQHTTQKTTFSVNTLVTALLWQVISEVRLARFRTSHPAVASELVSEIVMGVNSRTAFEREGLLKKEGWIGNLATELTPKPVLKFNDISSASSINLELDTPQRDVEEKVQVPITMSVSSILPKIIDDITYKLAKMTPSHVAKYVHDAEASIPPPNNQTTFSYRSLRNIASMISGLNLIVTAWSNFSFYPHFGTAGRPEYLRLPGQGGIDGIVVILPRKRESDGWSAEEIDTFEVMLSLREDDMKEFEAKDVIQKLFI